MCLKKNCFWYFHKTLGSEAYSGAMGAGPVKSIDCRGFSGPNMCWAPPPGKKIISAPSPPEQFPDQDSFMKHKKNICLDLVVYKDEGAEVALMLSKIRKTLNKILGNYI